jgi:hypothetical protein
MWRNNKRSAHMEKYLICRPEGGFTDVLSQVSLCFNYCLRHRRVLVIDTLHSTSFASPFRHFFSFVHDSVKVVTDPRELIRTAISKGLSVHPAHARLNPKGHVPPRYTKNLNFCLDGIPLTFDFDCDHDAAVLIHQQCGRTPFDLEFMSCLRLTPRLRGLVERRWASLPKPYIGVHARNTDIKSDPDKVMPLVRRYPGAVFLATDSAALQRSVRKGAKRRIFTSKIPDFTGKPLHHRNVSPKMKIRINTVAIVDLILLALSKRVFLTTEASGYSLLARELNQNRHVVIAWLGRDLAAGSYPWWSDANLAIGTIKGAFPRCAAWYHASKAAQPLCVGRRKPDCVTAFQPNV